MEQNQPQWPTTNRSMCVRHTIKVYWLLQTGLDADFLTLTKQVSTEQLVRDIIELMVNTVGDN